MTEQPKCMVNGKLEPHQIDSLNWMISLYDLGLNGILADDMVSNLLKFKYGYVGSGEDHSVDIHTLLLV